MSQKLCRVWYNGEYFYNFQLIFSNAEVIGVGFCFSEEEWKVRGYNVGWDDVPIDLCVVEYYTGVNDKHGNKIFEGDLIGGDGPAKPTEVKFQAHAQSVVHGHGDVGETCYIGYKPEHGWYSWTECEIVGNTHVGVARERD